MTDFSRACLLATLLALPTLPAFAADPWPQKPVRFIVPFVPGGATDLLARYLAEKLTESLGVSVVVDNRGGAGGTLGAGLVAKAAPDGYTFMFTSPSHTFAPSFYRTCRTTPCGTSSRSRCSRRHPTSWSCTHPCR